MDRHRSHWVADSIYIYEALNQKHRYKMVQWYFAPEIEVFLPLMGDIIPVLISKVTFLAIPDPAVDPMKNSNSVC